MNSIETFEYFQNNIKSVFGVIISKTFYDAALTIARSKKESVIDEFLNIDCKNCVNCFLCVGCINCTGCAYCIDCYNCINCKSCKLCAICENNYVCYKNICCSYCYKINKQKNEYGLDIQFSIYEN
jgi:hypothetical protein